MTRVAVATIVVALVAAACSSSSKPTKPATTASSTTASSTATTSASASGTWAAYHHDAARTGVADDQTPIGKVHKAWDSATLDGDVYAEPLVVGGHVIAATEANSVYAFDAATGAQVWRAQLGPPVNGDSLPCGNINPSGITGTPIADVTGNSLYVVAFLAAGTHHELYALDLGNGAVKWHRPVDPAGLAGRVEQQRGALAIDAGRVYIPYGGLLGDCGSYKGAVVSSALDGQGELTNYVVPTTREAAIWHPGGPVVAPTGDLFVSTGNSESRGKFDYGNTVVRLNAQLQAMDYFAPTNWPRLNASDTDLGSIGPVLVGTNRVLASGKEGVAYLLDRGHLGNIGAGLTSIQACGGAFGTAAVLGARVFLPCTDGLVALGTDNDRLTVGWKAPGRAGPPILAGSVVWVLFGNGRLSALDPQGGRELFGAQVGEPASRFVSMAAAAGRLFVAPTNKVTAFALR
ncbi:MAG: PQQ-binding-like beta-propeller repeat protein [Acidimicrobiia bacterium]|nr:PQQ-binding-like beta-propeller repeat protein [Acidimicrobiia bacterium]